MGDADTISEDETNPDPLPTDKRSSGEIVESAVNSLSQEFVGCFDDDLKVIQEKLSHVHQTQSVLVESLSQEKKKVAKCESIDEIETAMVQINHYRLKLIRMKKNMAVLKEHSHRLRKEALRLQQLKQKENLKREELRQKTIAEERSLVAQLYP